MEELLSVRLHNAILTYHDDDAHVNLLVEAYGTSAFYESMVSMCPMLAHVTIQQFIQGFTLALQQLNVSGATVSPETFFDILRLTLDGFQEMAQRKQQLTTRGTFTFESFFKAILIHILQGRI